ncbi:MAG: hypothetical protein ACK5YR_10375 [Pirellula sp.]
MLFKKGPDRLDAEIEHVRSVIKNLPDTVVPIRGALCDSRLKLNTFVELANAVSPYAIFSVV